MTGHILALGAGTPLVSGTFWTGAIVAIIALGLMFARKRRGMGWETICLIVGILIIGFSLLAHHPLHSVPIPGH